MAHSIEFDRSARKEIAALPRDIKNRVIAATIALADNPRPRSCKKLTGQDLYRIRIGDYRVIYEIHDDVLIVLVVRIAHRGEAYKA
jgi:mRNA interferase RelE/StbE